MPKPEWNDFRLFSAIAETGSVAAAGRELGLDNSTISRRLAALEEALGADLCLRTARGIILTAEGQSVLSAARQMTEAVSACVTAVSAAKTGMEGTVRVTCVNSMVPFLAPMLGDLRTRYPELRVQFTAEDTITDLAQGGADIAVRMLRPKEVDLIARKGVDIGWSFYAAKHHVAVHGMAKSLDDLKSRHLIPYTSRLKAPAFMWYAEEFHDCLSGAEAGSPEAALLIASQTDYVAFVPCAWAESMSSLVRVLDEVTKMNEAYVVYHEAQRNTARIKMVADALMDFLKERRKFFAGEP